MHPPMKHLLKYSLPCALLLFLIPFSAASARAAEKPKEPLPVAFFKNVQAGKKQTVVVYGTSLSSGAEWPKALKGYFDNQFPGLVAFSNSAQAGQQSNWGVANFQDRVLSKSPDLVFIEFS